MLPAHIVPVGAQAALAPVAYPYTSGNPTIVVAPNSNIARLLTGCPRVWNGGDRDGELPLATASVLLCFALHLTRQVRALSVGATVRMEKLNELDALLSCITEKPVDLEEAVLVFAEVICAAGQDTLGVGDMLPREPAVGVQVEQEAVFALMQIDQWVDEDESIGRYLQLMACCNGALAWRKGRVARVLGNLFAAPPVGAAAAPQPGARDVDPRLVQTERCLAALHGENNLLAASMTDNAANVARKGFRMLGAPPYARRIVLAHSDIMDASAWLIAYGRGDDAAVERVLPRMLCQPHLVRLRRLLGYQLQIGARCGPADLAVIVTMAQEGLRPQAPVHHPLGAAQLDLLELSLEAFDHALPPLGGAAGAPGMPVVRAADCARIARANVFRFIGVVKSAAQDGGSGGITFGNAISSLGESELVVGAGMQLGGGGNRLPRAKVAIALEAARAQLDQIERLGSTQQGRRAVVPVVLRSGSPLLRAAFGMLIHYTNEPALPVIFASAPLLSIVVAEKLVASNILGADGLAARADRMKLFLPNAQLVGHVTGDSRVSVNILFNIFDARRRVLLGLTIGEYTPSFDLVEVFRGVLLEEYIEFVVLFYALLGEDASCFQHPVVGVLNMRRQLSSVTSGEGRPLAKALAADLEQTIEDHERAMAAWRINGLSAASLDPLPPMTMVSTLADSFRTKIRKLQARNDSAKLAAELNDEVLWGGSSGGGYGGSGHAGGQDGGEPPPAAAGANHVERGNGASLLSPGSPLIGRGGGGSLAPGRNSGDGHLAYRGGPARYGGDHQGGMPYGTGGGGGPRDGWCGEGGAYGSGGEQQGRSESRARGQVVLSGILASERRRLFGACVDNACRWHSGEGWVSMHGNVFSLPALRERWLAHTGSALDLSILPALLTKASNEESCISRLPLNTSGVIADHALVFWAQRMASSCLAPQNFGQPRGN